MSDKKNMSPLTKNEILKIRDTLDKLEQEALLSFKFANAEIFFYDENFIDIELKLGNGNESYTEQYVIDRRTLEIRD